LGGSPLVCVRKSFICSSSWRQGFILLVAALPKFHGKI
jgi:hypothetical protein